MEKDQIENQNKEIFLKVLKTHLDAVSKKDMDMLKSTLSLSGKMQLIQPNTKVTYTTDEFLKVHEGWFKDPSWSMETKILVSNIGQVIGAATTQFIYRKPDLNGETFVNRMIVSYVLEKQGDHWYVIKDHATSIETFRE